VTSAKEFDEKLALVRSLRGIVDAINIPEIREETRQGARPAKMPERIEPRVFAKAIRSNGMETIINRVTVHDAEADQLRWLKETYSDYEIRNMVLVGGESHTHAYPGPSVPRTAELAVREGLDFFFGGITIPSRSQEAERIRKKYEQGLRYFTTQVLFDSNDIVNLVQSLNGLDVRIFLSFAPISGPKDVEFLKWLGVDVPKNVSWLISQVSDAANAVDKSIAHAARILIDTFENLPAHPPGLGINIEQITRRNNDPARRMLDTVGALYRRFLQARYAASSVLEQPAI
jgi:5,10-methylenetetrahydrofolate reductase